VNQIKQEKARSPWMDCLRLLAAVAVIIIHVVAKQWHTADVHSSNWLVLCLYNCSVRWCVPLFVMISGALFLAPEKHISLRDLYGKYILRLLIAYFVWGAIYALLDYDGTVAGFAEDLIAGYYHMWYLPMLAGLYAMLPLLRKITESEKLTGYFLILVLIGGFFIPNAISVLQELTVAGGWLADLWANAGMQLVFDYSGYFVAGYVLSKLELQKRWRVLIYGAGVLGWLFTLGVPFVYGKYAGHSTVIVMGYEYLNVALQAVALFVFGKYELQRIAFSQKVINWLGGASKGSFGVYLTHVLVLELILRFFGDTLAAVPVALWIPCMTVLVLLISSGISWLLNRMPVVKKYLV
jgi:surface polysaccharide O-acyltransferase-like enzyme